MKEVTNKIINLFFMPLSVISLIGAVAELPNIIQNVPNRTLAILIVGGLILWMLFLLKNTYFIKKFSSLVSNLIKRHKLVILIIAFTVVLIWQLSMVFYLSGISFWDPRSLSLVATGHLPSLKDYFSLNPNNLLMLLFERAIWVVSQRPSMEQFQMTLGVINVVIIDMAFFLLANVIHSRIGTGMKAIIPIAMMLILVIASPWVVIVYTDLFGFFLTAINIFLLSKMTVVSKKLGSYFYPVCSSFFLIVSYFIKPTLIIIYIAAVLIAIVRWCIKEKKLSLKSIKVVSIVIISTAAFFILISAGLKSQKVVKIDPQRKETVFHYLAMGMHGTGGFNIDDVNMEIGIKNPKKRNAENIKLIKKRIKEYHSPINYVKFLISKQMANTANGTFSWGHEGGFLVTFNHENKNYNRSIQRRLFTNAGVVDTTEYSYQFIAQILWILTLIGVLFCYGNSSLFAQFLKTSIIGFYIFLLLFEGGRSRYVIQFLPCIFLAMSFGIDNVLKSVNIKSWE
ncbi:glycosyltransferase family protein [Paucilactobacillus sp. N302-9]